MPCSKYKGGQRRLCYATDEWRHWSKIKMKPKKSNMKPIGFGIFNISKNKFQNKMIFDTADMAMKHIAKYMMNSKYLIPRKRYRL